MINEKNILNCLEPRVFIIILRVISWYITWNKGPTYL